MTTYVNIQLGQDQQQALIKLKPYIQAWQADQKKANRPVRKFATILGGPGAGKTTLVKTLLSELHIQPSEIISMSMSLSAAEHAKDVLQAKFATSVAQFIKTPVSQIHVFDNNENKIISSYDELYVYLKALSRDTTRYPDVTKAEREQTITYIMNTANDYRKKHKSIDGLLQTLDIEQIKGAYPLRMKHHMAFIERDHIPESKPDFLEGINYVFLDEISFVTQDDVELLENMFHHYGLICIAAGDRDQLPPVNKPDNTYVTANINEPHVALLTQIFRQADGSKLLEFIKHVRDTGSLSTAWYNIQYTATAPIQDVHVRDEKYMQPHVFNELLLSAHHIIAYTNNDVKRINKQVRKLIFANEYEATPHSFDNNIFIGERLIVTRNESLPSVEDHDILPHRLINGSKGTVLMEHAIEEIEQELAQAGLKPHDWKDFAHLVKAVGLRNVTVLFDGMPAPERIWVNTHEIADPRINEVLLKNNSAHKHVPNIYYQLHKKYFGNEHHVLYNRNHSRVLYVTYGYASTVHKAQGREWNNVIYVPPTHSLNDFDFERRLHHTAASRAKNVLVMLRLDYTKNV